MLPAAVSTAHQMLLQLVAFMLLQAVSWRLPAVHETRCECPVDLSCRQCIHFQVLQQVEGFSAINCSNTLWACATLRYYHQGLFEALLERMTAHLDEVEPQNVANCLYAFARVNHSLGRHTGAAAGPLHWRL